MKICCTSQSMTWRCVKKHHCHISTDILWKRKKRLSLYYLTIIYNPHIFISKGLRNVHPGFYSPRQLAFIGHVTVWFLMRYAFSDVRLGLFRNVPSSFFHTYVIAVCSYDTETNKRTKIYVNPTII